MAIARPSLQELTDKIYNRIKSETSITAGLGGTGVGVLVKIIATEFDQLYSQLEEIEKQSNLSTATGSYLDGMGLLLGVVRKDTQKATTSGKTRSVRFTNNGSFSVTIPSGTRIWRSTDPQQAFFTTEGVTINAGQSSDVHANAADIGEYYNVPINSLNTHNYPGASVTVTNILPIQNGSLRESDASYRNRLIQEFQRRDALTLGNTEALLRSIPGVRDVFILNQKRGAGTFDAVVIPYNQTSTADVVTEANRLLSENVPVGISAVAKPPIYRQLDVKVALRFSPTNPESWQAIRESIRAQIIARIDNLPVENGTGIGTFTTNQIRALSINADISVLEAGVTLGLDGSPISTNGEIKLGIGERIILRGLSVQ